MSYVVTIEVLCDEPACVRGLRFTKTNEGGLSKTLAGNLAAEKGWQVPGGRSSGADPVRAYCPDHRRPTRT